MVEGAQQQMTAKNTAGPLICLMACNGIMAYFFGTYYLNNPDQKGADGELFNCYTGSVG